MNATNSEFGGHYLIINKLWWQATTAASDLEERDHLPTGISSVKEDTRLGYYITMLAENLECSKKGFDNSRMGRSSYKCNDHTEASPYSHGDAFFYDVV